MNRPSSQELTAVIDAIEAEMVREWIGCETDVDRQWERKRERIAMQRQANFDTTQDWLADTRKQAHEKEGYRSDEPSVWRVLGHTLSKLPRRLWSGR